MPPTVDEDRRALKSVGAQFFVNGAVVASFVPRLPEIRDRLDLTVDEIGWVLAAAGVVGLAASAVVSLLIERFGTRRIMIGGGIGLVGGLAVVGIATHWILLVVGLAISSFFDLVVDAAMNLQASWLSARRSTPVINRMHGLWSLGTVVGGLASARVAASGVSIQMHLLIAAAALGIALVALAPGLLRSDQVGGGAEAAPRRAGRSARSLVVFALLGACAFAVEITSSDWAAFRLTDDLGASAGLAGLGFVAFTFGMTVSRFAGDAVQRALGPDRLLEVALVVAAVGITGASLVRSETLAVLLFAVAGTGIAPLFPRLYDEAARRPGRQGAGLGALTAGSRVASFVAPAFVGTVAATGLAVGGAVVVLVVPLLIGIAMLSTGPAGWRTIVRSGA